MPAPDRTSSAYHAPVLASEVVGLLGGATRALDCTLGGGGHSLALLQAGVRHLSGIDRDPEAVFASRARLAAYEAEGRFTAIPGNFYNLEEIEELADSRFGAILVDLGISSHQIDDASRGFTFREGAPLDMRMGADAPATAAELLDQLPESELTRIFRSYGDEPRSGRLAREIVRRRANRPPVTSDDLVGAIRGALGPRTGPPDFARLFQALRIAVNDEIAGLERALPALRDRLEPGGVLAVIAYHSGEDRLVKHSFRNWSAECVCPPRQPMCTCRGRALGTTLTRRARVASDQEVEANPRARSARLRAWQSAR